MMDVIKVLDILPHRYPFMLVDKVLEVTEDTIRCQKNVTFNEEFFQGHFPGYPVMPGVLQIEALAQTICILAAQKEGGLGENMVAFFMGIDKAKFRKPVVPGDVLILESKLLKYKRGLAVAECRAYVDGELVCEAELKAMVKAK